MGLRRRTLLRQLTLTLLLALGWLLHPGTAGADETVSQRAERLFRQGLSLIQVGDYRSACPLLEESDHVEHAIGTAFDLADCYEHTGKLAAALTLFVRVQREALAGGKTEREKITAARVSALAPKVAILEVKVDQPPPSLHLLLDGVELPAPPPDALLVDAGSHTLSAAAPGRRAWRTDFAAALGTRQTLVVPPLEREPAAAGRDPRQVIPSSNEGAPPAAAPSTQKGAAIVAFAVGAAGVVAGSVAGAVSLIAHGRAQTECPKDKFNYACPSQTGADDWNLATSSGNVATAGFITAGAGMGIAALLWLTAPSNPSPSPARASVQPLPLVGATFGGVALKGTL